MFSNAKNKRSKITGMGNIGHCHLNLFIIIITLFQEDNIFGMNVSLTYGPYMPLIITERNDNYLQYVHSR